MNSSLLMIFVGLVVLVCGICWINLDAKEEKTKAYISMMEAKKHELAVQYPLGSTVYVGEMMTPATVVGHGASGMANSPTKDNSAVVILSLAVLIDGKNVNVPLEALRTSKIQAKD